MRGLRRISPRTKAVPIDSSRSNLLRGATLICANLPILYPVGGTMALGSVRRSVSRRSTDCREPRGLMAKPLPSHFRSQCRSNAPLAGVRAQRTGAELYAELGVAQAEILVASQLSNPRLDYSTLTMSFSSVFVIRCAATQEREVRGVVCSAALTLSLHCQTFPARGSGQYQASRSHCIAVVSDKRLQVAP